jgi:hypothetical protein
MAFPASANYIKDTTEELRSITAQYVISNKAAQLHPVPSSSREASPDIIIQYAVEGTMGDKNRCKPHRQETATTADNDGGINKQAGSTIMVRAATITGSGNAGDEEFYGLQEAP